MENISNNEIVKTMHNRYKWMRWFDEFIASGDSIKTVPTGGRKIHSLDLNLRICIKRHGYPCRVISRGNTIYAVKNGVDVTGLIPKIIRPKKKQVLEEITSQPTIQSQQPTQ